MTSFKFSLLNVLLLVFLNNYSVSALKCYACTVNIGDIDQRCVTDPGEVQVGQKIVDCNKEYCTSKRVEYKDPPGKVHSMHRGCDSDPEQMNTIIEDSTFVTYYRACRVDLCNGGSGKGGEGGWGLDPEQGDATVLYVNGINGASREGVSLGVWVFGGVVGLLVRGPW